MKKDKTKPSNVFFDEITHKEWTTSHESVSFEIPNTPENRKSIRELMDRANKALKEELDKITLMLEEASKEEAKKWSVNDVSAKEDPNVLDPIARLIYSGAVLGWNMCMEHYKDRIRSYED